MPTQVITLIVVGAIMFLVIGGLAFLSHYYTLDGIKSKTVGDGQHGTRTLGYQTGDSADLCPCPF